MIVYNPALVVMVVVILMTITMIAASGIKMLSKMTHCLLSVIMTLHNCHVKMDPGSFLTMF